MPHDERRADERQQRAGSDAAAEAAVVIVAFAGIPRAAVWHDAVNRPHQIYHGEPIAGLT